VNFDPSDQSRNTKGDLTTRNILQHVGRDAFIVCPDYNFAMFLWYHTLVGEWKDRNIHIVFNHDKTIPYKEIGDFTGQNTSFAVPVSRDTITAGLNGFLFIDYYEWSVEHLLERKPLAPDDLEKSLREKLEKYQTQFSASHIDIKQESGYLYRLVPRKRVL